MKRIAKKEFKIILRSKGLRFNRKIDMQKLGQIIELLGYFEKHGLISRE